MQIKSVGGAFKLTQCQASRAQAALQARQRSTVSNQYVTVHATKVDEAFLESSGTGANNAMTIKQLSNCYGVLNKKPRKGLFYWLLLSTLVLK